MRESNAGTIGITAVSQKIKQPLDGERLKVLMAEDSVAMQVLLERQLSGWGLDVIVANDGAQAWELFKQHEMSLVLTDWIMPNMDGLELIRRIRAHPTKRYVYVILLTAKTEKEDLVEAMDAGADDFLVKPCANQELRVRLREGTRILKLEQTLADQNLAIRNAQAALVQNEKLAGLGQLAAGMAHEINNPVSFVTNNLAVLRRDMDSLLEIVDAYRACRGDLELTNQDAVSAIDQLEKKHDLQWIQDNTPTMFDASMKGLKRVCDIVKNLRNFARLDEADYDEIRIGDTIRSTLSLLKHVLDEKQVMLILNDESNPSILCCGAMINQVLHNILMNAIQACQVGDQVTINIVPSERTVCVEIIDTGSGIDPDVLPKIFEPFFTTRSVGEGTGLGLSLCYGVVRDHGGEIDVLSQPNEGTTVRIQLPRQPTSQTDNETLE
jgi:two-component system NtrC family sensor kinase